MKHAGSVKKIVGWTLLLASTCGALTPPRIIYGGWTPILPGHPFYFGPVKHRNNDVEQQNYHPQEQQRFTELHHFKHHLEFVEQPRFKQQQNVYAPNDDTYKAQKQDVSYQNNNELYQGKEKSNYKTNNKNIFAYYPPQSVYDEPKRPPPNLDIKPVYFEAPKRPDIKPVYFEKQPLDISSLVPILKGTGFNPDSYSLGQGGGEKTYLKITPLADVDLSQIRYLNPSATYPVIKDSSFKYLSDYPVIKDLPIIDGYSTGSPKSNSFVSPLKYHQLGDELPYKILEPTTYNLHLNDQRTSTLKQPLLNPIQTKQLRDILSQADKQINDLARPTYSSKRPYGVGKKVLSPAAKNFAHQMRTYLGSSAPFYPKTILPTSLSTPYKPQKNYLPLTSLNHLYKKVPGSVVGKIRGTPAIVEREVAIIHMPVTSPEKEYLYLTASTPESTQIVGQNDSRSSEGLPSPVQEYIFVSKGGTEGGGDRQFFHAYYAPADHKPPPTYVKMTVQEFNNLFKNAEIRYMDKDLPL